MITEIIKRNGTTVPFDKNKIVVVMKKAFAAESVPISDEVLLQMADRVVAKLETICEGKTACATVEKVQDLVEETLMERGYFDVAKAFILYRFRQTEERKQEVVKEIEEHRLMIQRTDGSMEQFSHEKMREYIAQFTKGFEEIIDLDEITTQVEREVYDSITSDEMAKVVTLILRAHIEEDPAYSQAAARQLCDRLYRQAIGNIGNLSEEEWVQVYRAAFVRNVRRGVEAKKLDERMLSLDLERLSEAIEPSRDELFRYLGVETLNDRYFIRLSEKDTLETPQMMWMRVAVGLALNEEQKEVRAIEFYNVMSTLRFVPSTPTLFHAGTPHPQLSSCYLNVVEDDLNHIFKVYGDNAQLSKWAGGIGTAWTKLRATGGLIKTAGISSQGTIPFLKIANDVTVAINRSGRRRGATCVYMENWHLDFPDFLELRKNTGDERRRTHDMNTASWVSDLFMKRVKEDGDWTLFSPDEAVDLTETYGKRFEELYTKYEEMVDRGEIKLWKRMKARDLWKKHLSMLYETGHPWVTFKDPSNIRSPQDHVGVVHNSNLCCMTADQRVVTSEGLVTVGYLYEKARTLGLVSADGNTPMVSGSTNTVFGRSGAVSAGPMLRPRPNASIVNITTREGYSHKVTPDHKVWVVDRGWTEAQNLQRGDKIEIQQKPGLWGTTDAPHDAYVCGIVAGDGTFMVRENTTSVMIDVWANEFSLMEEIETMVGASILANGEHEFRTTSRRRPRFVGNDYKKRLTSAPLARALAKRGFTHKTKLAVPEFVWTGTRETVAAYLRGLYVADGTVQASGEITTCSLASREKQFLSDIQILLANFGVKSCLRKMKDGAPALLPDGNGGSKEYVQSELWRLMVTSVQGCKIMEEITGLGKLRGNTTYLKNLEKTGYAQKMHATFETLETLPSEDAYCLHVFTDEHSWTVNGMITKNTEITLNTSAEETAVCNLGSVNYKTHMDGPRFDEAKVRETVTTAMRMLDNVIDLNFYPTKEARTANMRHRPVGLGAMGFQDSLYLQNIPFDSEECVAFADRSMEVIAHAAILASTELARERGAYESFEGSKWDRGILPLDTVSLLENERGVATGIDKTERLDWNEVRAAIRQYGMRNSNCMAIAPTATISNIAGVTLGIEPIYKNIYVKANISGDFIVVNTHLVQALKERGLWNREMLDRIKYNDGSLQDIDIVPQDIKDTYKETFEIDMRWLVRVAATRGKWIDQSQSLNMFYSGTSGREISELYLYAWEMGVKTTYYLRTLGASQVEKSTINTKGTQLRKKREKDTTDGKGTPSVLVGVSAPAAVGASVPAEASATGAIKSPMPTPSPISKEAVEKSKIAVERSEYSHGQMAEKKASKEVKLHIAPEAVCEACE